MGRFVNDKTKVVVSVADEKDDRFGAGWTREDPPVKNKKPAASAS